MLVKPGISADGFRVAVRDYTEFTVVEELAANSYDADATTVVVLLDTAQGTLHVLDNGIGFSREAFERMAVLGAGEKQTTIPYSKGKRHYLGSYGFGLKSTLNVANSIRVYSISDEGEFSVTIDWTKLEEGLRADFPGFSVDDKKKRKGTGTGTHIFLNLKNPTSKDHLEKFAAVLANLPEDSGNFRCYYGLYSDVAKELKTLDGDFAKLDHLAKRLSHGKRISTVDASFSADLGQCEVIETKDKIDKNVSSKFFFAGIENGRVLPIKPGLRGIYIRIHGRILKQSFTDRRYTYPISKWVKFESGLRVELSIDWLRDQISLSREGIRFSNTKLEDDFKAVLTRLVSGFIQPQLKKLQQKTEREAARKYKQRMELAKKRSNGDKSIRISALADHGFTFIPETDGELALVLSQRPVLKKLNPSFRLVDYNDQAAFDCILYDKTRMQLINTELEPTLMEFLQHKETTDVMMLITWSKGKWRIGAKKKGIGGVYELVVTEGKNPGHYNLLEYSSWKTKSPRKKYPLFVLEELFGK